MNNKIQEIC